MKLELGGGRRPRGDGFVNMDRWDGADIIHDLNVRPWPIETGSVDELYSSHCLEHLEEFDTALIEIGRVCRVGAQVVLRQPDPMSEGAMAQGHTGVIGEVWLRNALQHFPSEGWRAIGKILRLDSVTPRADPTWFPRARQSNVFRRYTDLDILRYVPRCCHENEFMLTVIPHPAGGP